MTTTASTLRRWIPAILSGAATAAVFAGIYAWRNPDQPALVAFAVMAVVSWPILTFAFQLLWFDRSRTNAEVDKGKDDVERMWITEAAANAFAGTLGGLVFLETVGSAFRISWLSPITLTHVLVLAIGLFVACYAWVRTQGR